MAIDIGETWTVEIDGTAYRVAAWQREAVLNPNKGPTIEVLLEDDNGNERSLVLAFPRIWQWMSFIGESDEPTHS